LTCDFAVGVAIEFSVSPDELEKDLSKSGEMGNQVSDRNGFRHYITGKCKSRFTTATLLTWN